MLFRSNTRLRPLRRPPRGRPAPLAGRVGAGIDLSAPVCLIMGPRARGLGRPLRRPPRRRLHPVTRGWPRPSISGTGGPSYQPGWNWCSACQSLFYAANGHAVESVCPAATVFGGPHKTGGFAYSVLYNDAVSGSSQGGWWWCGQCQGLFNAATGIGGWCPGDGGGGPHISGQTDPTINSLAYDVSYYSTSSP